jgi:hypothetical protein
MSTLVVVEQILRETQVPMSVREIVVRAGERLPTRSKTPDTVVARDLSMDLKRKGDDSIFIRTSPGRYTLRALHLAKLEQAERGTVVTPPPPTEVLTTALRHERAPALAAKKPGERKESAAQSSN